jgi:hypothetical protein
MGDLKKDIETLLNQHGADTKTGTPDYVLAKFLQTCLNAFATAVYDRDKHAGIPLGDERRSPC